MSWLNQGYEGIGKEEQRIASMTGPRRLWLPPGSGRKLVLVDDIPACIYEHNAKINGTWQNQHTCMQGADDTCESCTRLGNKSRYYVGYLTCIDCTEYIDKKGNKYQYELKLVGGKLGLLKKWRRKKEEKGSLLLSKWNIHREDDKKAATGDEWEFDGEVSDPKKLFELANYKGKKLSELWEKAMANAESLALLKQTFQLQLDEAGKLLRTVAPFNYMEVLKPRGNDYIRDLLGGVSKEEALGQTDDSESSGEGAEDDVPF